MHAFRGANLTDRSRFDGDDPQWHLVNIVGTFDALEDVFEKQTKSPSIKSCYDLRDLASGGVFVLRPGANFNDTLVVLTGGTPDRPFFSVLPSLPHSSFVFEGQSLTQIFSILTLAHAIDAAKCFGFKVESRRI